MYARKGQLAILIVNLIALVVFSVHFWVKANYEFIMYIGVITFFLIVFVTTNSKVYYPNGLLWGLTLWALMHLSGGALYFNGTLLYQIILIPLSDKLPIFRYDQFVHIFGFGVSTILMFYVLKPLLKPKLDGYWALSIVVIMAGLGVGALNEIVEFITASIVPETGVGGYLNTSLDLVADLIGALLAVVIIRFVERSLFISTPAKTLRRSHLIIYLPTAIVLFFWPIAPAVALVQGYILSEEATLTLRVCRYCGPESRIVDIIYFSIAAVGLWWALLGAVCQIRTNVAKLVFWPFSEIFARKAVKILMTVGIIIGIVFTGAIILSISPFFQP